MPLQNHPKSRLPKWLPIVIIGMFVAHYFTVALNHFSKELLPKKYYYLTNQYLVPWFYQNLTAFAPEPPYRRHVFVYRLRSNTNWSEWKQPARPHLERQWNNRFSISVKIHDQLENLAEQLYDSGDRDKTNVGLLRFAKHSYVLDAARRYAKNYDDEVLNALEIQVAVYIAEYGVDNNQMAIRDTAYIFESMPL